jgi:hypothetical protein
MSADEDRKRVREAYIRDMGRELKFISTLAIPYPLLPHTPIPSLRFI